LRISCCCLIFFRFTARHAPPVRMIKLTESQEITPYKWVHPNEGR